MAKIGKETGKSQYKNGKSILGEFFINQTNSQATPSPVITARTISIFFTYSFYQKIKVLTTAFGFVSLRMLNNYFQRKSAL